MQQTINQTPVKQNNTVPSVVLNDKSRVIATTAKASAVSTATAVAALSIEGIAAERKKWEQNAYRTSNKQLYAVLAQCYAFYLQMQESSEQAKALKTQLNAFISEHELRFTGSSHGINKVLKCVFFNNDTSVDRRRISTYSIVLRSALALKIAADKLAQYIEAAGGVQELRLAKSPNAKTAKQKAALGAASLEDAPVLATVRSDAFTKLLDADDYEKPLAAIVVARSDGSIELRSVLKSTGAINALLTAQGSAAIKAESTQKAA